MTGRSPNPYLDTNGKPISAGLPGTVFPPFALVKTDKLRASPQAQFQANDLHHQANHFGITARPLPPLPMADKAPVVLPEVPPPVKYLGSTPVDLTTHPLYSKYTGSDWAMLFNEMYGGIDGEHHKTWVLDQIARLLKGTPMIANLAKWSCGQEEYRFQTGAPSQAYLAWVDSLLEEGQDIDDYDVGIAP